MKKKIIKVPMKTARIFPYGDVLVPDLTSKNKMEKNKELESFREEAFRKYTDKDFVKDIESIFIAYGKKDVRKIGLINLVKTIREQGRKEVLQIAKDVKDKKKAIIRETDIGEFDKFVSIHYLEEQNAKISKRFR